MNATYAKRSYVLKNMSTPEVRVALDVGLITLGDELSST